MRINPGVDWHLNLVTEPASEPLDVAATLEDHLLVLDSAAETDNVTTLIKVAREHAEGFLRRALITQTWELLMDRFPVTEIEIPLSPLQSVAGITYVDTAGATKTWATSNYQVSAPSGPRPRRGRVRPVYGKTFPSDARCEMDGVTVTFVAGYGDAGTDVPEKIRQGMRLIVGELFMQRKESLQDVFQHEAVIRAENLWFGYRSH